MKHRSLQKGFSLVEMLIYIAVLIVIFIVILNTILSFTGTYRVLSARRIVEHSAMGAMERMTRDIRSAKTVDTANSTFLTSPGVLTLVATQSGVCTTTKFYVQNGVLKVDVNGSYFGPLTVSNVTVTNLVFTNLTSTNSSAIKIDLTLQGSLGTTTQTMSYHSTVVLKGQ